MLRGLQPDFFPGARLNFAQNLLFPLCEPTDDAIAVIEANEVARQTVTWSQLRERVRACSRAMRNCGIESGDRVAGYVANNSNALVAMLSATSLGAIWSGVSPDSGVSTVLDRLQQIDPKILFADNAVIYNDKTHSSQHKLKDIIAGLHQLKFAVIFETVPTVTVDLVKFSYSNKRTWLFTEFIETMGNDMPLVFDQFPADHPVYILYSSGTTGKPKCIVHGA